MRIKVRVWTQRNAPGMYLTRPVSDAHTKRILAVVKSNGGEPSDGSAYVHRLEDLPFVVDHPARRDIEAGWDRVFIVEAWDYAHVYGYDAHTAFGPQ